MKPGSDFASNAWVLQAEDLVRHYAARTQPGRGAATVRALRGVSLRVPPAHVLAVVGESGCGKSTLARLLSFADAPDSGALRLRGAAIDPRRRDDLRRARAAVQMLFQNARGSLNPRHRVWRALEEPLRIHTRLDAAERGQRVLDMLQRVGLQAEHGRRYPHMLSGGQGQRVAIARALMLEPAVVVADEPASALDVSVQAQVLNLLLDLRRDLGLALVFISHDLAVVRHVADSLAVMYAGRVVESGGREPVLGRPLHPYTRALLAATPKLDAASAGPVLRGEPPSPLAPPTGCAFHPRCPHAQQCCRDEQPALRELLGRDVACHRAELIAELDASTSTPTPGSACRDACADGASPSSGTSWSAHGIAPPACPSTDSTASTD
ncbi:MAG: dipeptide ABC transporter ATP-binding protein [Betaproteobacteria bacterium]|nr:dipeptide ABC transporter ATP-binding protein [Betaproteobacteria bacterium]